MAVLYDQYRNIARMVEIVVVVALMKRVTFWLWMMMSIFDDVLI